VDRDRVRAIQYPSAISAMVAAFVGREPKVTEMLPKRIESSDPVVVRVGDEDPEVAVDRDPAGVRVT
jgi:hypothetical protein